MGLLNSLLRAEQRIQKRIDRLFGKGASQTPLEMRREILDEVENSIIVAASHKVFPFSRIIIHLRTPDAHAREILAAAFLEDATLEKDIRRLLTESDCRVPESLEIVLDFEQAGPVSEGVHAGRFCLEFSRAEKGGAAKQQSGTPDAEFAILKGAAEQEVYRMTKTRIYVGRLKEVFDREGQLVRRNDVVFLDTGDEINSTVGRAHATVYFDEGRNEFRIVDEVSKYGTRIFRESRPIEVPSGNQRGIKLHPGDEIYLGRACLRFNIPGSA